jgi:uroporphyrin-III C-methyltransferase
MTSVQLPRRGAGRGTAYLVGAGPGRSDLITVRGLRLLQKADVVIYDRLVGRDLLDEIRPDADLIFVGKGAGRHVCTQEEINDLLVEQVAQGRSVVRLKGGDPFVFGRGGEEAQALWLAGLSYEIVPGVSSAIAAPAYAGIPVTQRNVATAFAVVTGHERADKDESDVDWEALARVPTLVILMGVKSIGLSAAALLAAGRSGETPAAIICRATTAEQRVVRTTLADLPFAVLAAGVISPATVVVGEVAALHDTLAWFDPGTAGLLCDFQPAAVLETLPVAATRE